MIEKKCLKKYWLKTPNLAQDIHLTDSRSSESPQKVKLKDILPQIHQNQTAENQRQQKRLETAKEKNDT